MRVKVAIDTSVLVGLIKGEDFLNRCRLEKRKLVVVMTGG